MEFQSHTKTISPYSPLSSLLQCTLFVAQCPKVVGSILHPSQLSNFLSKFSFVITPRGNVLSRHFQICENVFTSNFSLFPYHLSRPTNELRIEAGDGA